MNSRVLQVENGCYRILNYRRLGKKNQSEGHQLNLVHTENTKKVWWHSYLSKRWQKILLLSNVFEIVNCDILVKTLQNVILPILPGLTRRIKRPFSPSCHGSKTDWKKVTRTFRALPLRSKSGLCGRNAGSGQGYSGFDSRTWHESATKVVKTKNCDKFGKTSKKVNLSGQPIFCRPVR